MKITIEIGGNDYTFEMNRDVYYRQLMQDQEYIKMQELVSKKAQNKKITKFICRSLLLWRFLQVP